VSLLLLVAGPDVCASEFRLACLLTLVQPKKHKKKKRIREKTKASLQGREGIIAPSLYGTATISPSIAKHV
jgi:hypothetical protein